MHLNPVRTFACSMESRQGTEHGLSALAVVGLPIRQLERNREAASIDEGVNYGRKPAAGTAHVAIA